MLCSLMSDVTADDDTLILPAAAVDGWLTGSLGVTLTTRAVNTVIQSNTYILLTITKGAPPAL